MVSDKALGALMFAVGIIVIVVYVWALFFAGPFAWWVAISIVALVAVGAVCVVIAWVGYTLITTPAPTPPTLETETEEIETEKIEEKAEEKKEE
ncbi:transcriptional regulator [Candidatus Bathyarchaeota archaeon]|nr:MAG: transcriptional regulator [Candidatus Bathyarchaeota archaeon]